MNDRKRSRVTFETRQTRKLHKQNEKKSFEYCTVQARGFSPSIAWARIQKWQKIVIGKRAGKIRIQYGYDRRYAMLWLALGFQKREGYPEDLAQARNELIREAY